MDHQPTDMLLANLQEGLEQKGIAGRLVPFNQSQLVADAPRKFLLKDARGGTSGFVICASRAAPDLIGRGAQRARDARELLPCELRDVVLQPTFCSQLDGLSFALFPYCDPISSNRILRFIERRRLRPKIFEWLRLSTMKTSRTPDNLEAFETALNRIKSESLAPDVAAEALRQLGDGRWKPKFVLAHNDLWIGNVLHAPRDKQPRWPFVIIDWLGSATRGFAIFDLVRLAESLGLSTRALGEELEIHCALLGCELAQARFYLLAALGHIAQNLEQFPRERFRSMAESCWRTFTRACAQ